MQITAFDSKTHHTGNYLLEKVSYVVSVQGHDGKPVFPIQLLPRQDEARGNRTRGLTMCMGHITFIDSGSV
jgi:hypothetical protein